MKKLVKIRRLLEEAEDRGIDPDTIVVNPQDVHTLEPDELPLDDAEEEE